MKFFPAFRNFASIFFQEFFIIEHPCTVHTKAANYENDAYIVTQMRNAMHHILYTVVNSNAMNGWSASDTLKTVLPWWQTAIYALIAVLAVLTVLCAWQLSKALKRKKELADTAPAVDQK